jgi:hypothetical protein
MGIEDAYAPMLAGRSADQIFYLPASEPLQNRHAMG